MGRYNEILTGRYNKFLSKLFGMKGPAPSPQLAGDIAATLAFFNGVELRYLESWQRYGAEITVGAGGAGNRAAIRFRNPLGSNLIAVLEKFTVNQTGLGDNPQVTVHQTLAAVADFGTLLSTANASLDSRGQQSPTSSISSTGNAGAVTGMIIDAPSMVASTNYEIITYENQELVLVPGMAYTLWAGTLNQQLACTFRWRERFLEESERT